MSKPYKLLRAIFPMLLVSLLLIIGSYLYFSGVSNSVWDHSTEDLQKVTNSGGHSFSVHLTSESDLIHILSLHLAQFEANNAEEIQQAMESIRELSIDYFVVDLESGKVFSNHYPQGSYDKAELDKFKTTHGIVMNEPHKSQFTEQRVLSTYEMFRFADGTKAIIQSEHSIQSVVDEFSLELYGGGGRCYLINSDGKVLISANGGEDIPDFANIFDIYDRNNNSIESIQQFRNDLSLEKAGVLRFRYQGKAYVLAHAPLASTDKWSYLSVVPASVLKQYTHHVLLNEKLIWIPIVMVLLISLISAYEIIQRKKELNRQNRENDHLMKFLTGLGENTRTVFILFNHANYAVEYVSPNVERILGIPEKNVRTNLKALDATEYTDGIIVDYKLFSEVKPGAPITFDTNRTHSISGKQLHIEETVYRLSEQENKRLLLVLSDRTAHESLNG